MRLYCFGDSNTYGFDPRSFFGERYGAEDRWPELLGQLYGCEVINAGANGRIIPRNPYILRFLDNQPSVDIFLVMLGSNDLLQGASARETALRMGQFLKQIIPHFPQVLLISPPPMTRGAWVPSEELVAESRLLASEYEAVARELDIPFVDTRDWNIELCFDGVHFTEAGNHRFAENLKNSEIIP